MSHMDPRRQKADARPEAETVAFPDERDDGQMELVIAGDYRREGAWLSAATPVDLEEWR